jgi:hypothetical protein
MTTVNLISFEPSDIKSIQLECGACGATASFGLETWKRNTVQCPNCGTQLAVRGASPDRAWKAVDDMILALKELGDTNNNKFPFRLRLQFNRDD